MLKSIAQILLDSHNHNTSMEGACTEEMFSTLKEIAKDELIPKSIRKKLEERFFLPEKNNIYKIIKSLETYHEAFIFGGWRSISGGHALYMRLQKSGDEYTLTLYNRGSGITYFHQTSGVMTHPSVTFSPMTLKKETSLPECISKLLAPTFADFQSPHINRNSPDIGTVFYQYILQVVTLYTPHHRSISTTFPQRYPSDSSLVTQQRSGSCTWKSFTAIINDLVDLSTKDEYKHIITCFKIVALEKLKAKARTLPLAAKLYENALTAFCQRVTKSAPHHEINARLNHLLNQPAISSLLPVPKVTFSDFSLGDFSYQKNRSTPHLYQHKFLTLEQSFKNQPPSLKVEGQKLKWCLIHLKRIAKSVDCLKEILRTNCPIQPTRSPQTIEELVCHYTYNFFKIFSLAKSKRHIKKGCYDDFVAYLNLKFSRHTIRLETDLEKLELTTPFLPVIKEVLNDIEVILARLPKHNIKDKAFIKYLDHDICDYTYLKQDEIIGRTWLRDRWKIHHLSTYKWADNLKVEVSDDKAYSRFNLRATQQTSVWSDPQLGSKKPQPDVNAALSIITNRFQHFTEEKSAQQLRYAVTADQYSSPAHRLARLITHDACLEFASCWNGHASQPTDLFVRQHYIWASLLKNETLINLSREDVKLLTEHLESQFHENFRKQQLNNTYYLIHGIALFLRYLPYPSSVAAHLEAHDDLTLPSTHQPYPFVTEAAKRILKKITPLMNTPASSSDLTHMAVLLSSSLCIHTPKDPSLFFSFLTTLIAHNYPQNQISPQHSYLDNSIIAFTQSQIFDCWAALFEADLPHQFGNTPQFLSEIQLLQKQLNPDFSGLFFKNLDKKKGCQFAFQYRGEVHHLAIYEKGDVISTQPITINYLPNHIKFSDLFRKVFQDESHITDFFLKDGLFGFHYCQLQFVVTLDHTGDREQLLLYLNLDGEYYLYNGCGPDLTFFQSMHYWDGPRMSVMTDLMTDKNSHHLYFQAHSTKAPFFGPNGETLYPHPEYETVFSKITPKNHTIAVKLPNGSTTVHLLDFGLHFNRTDNTTHFRSIDYPGYTLVDTLSDIDTYFLSQIDFNHYLILSHPTKHPLVILPRYLPKKPNTETTEGPLIKHIRFCKYNINFESLDQFNEEPKYFVYSWDNKKQKLFHSAPDALLLLLQIFTHYDHVGNGIKEAFYYLNQLSHAVTLDAISKQALTLLADLETNTPEVIALKARLLGELNAYENQWSNIEFPFKESLERLQPMGPIPIDTPTITPTHYSLKTEKHTYYNASHNSTLSLTLPFLSKHVSNEQIFRSFYVRFKIMENGSYREISHPLFHATKQTEKKIPNPRGNAYTGYNIVNWNIDLDSVQVRSQWHDTYNHKKIVPHQLSYEKRDHTLTKDLPERLLPLENLQTFLKFPSGCRESVFSTEEMSLKEALEKGIIDAEHEFLTHRNELDRFIDEYRNTETSPRTKNKAFFIRHINEFLDEAKQYLEGLETEIHDIFMSMYSPISYRARTHLTDESFDLFLKTFAKIPSASQIDLNCDEHTYHILMYMAKCWLWVQTHIEHHERLIQNIEKPEELFKGLIATRNYQFDHDHSYLMLLMEHQENVRLRPAQFEMIDKLSSLEDGAFSNQIVEAIMGDGKTFIAPIVAVARARALPDKLSILQLPLSIFKPQQSGMSQQMKKVLGFEPLVFTYSREMTSIDWINTFFSLQTAQKNGIPLLTTAETIACLQLTFLENNYNHYLKNIIKLIREESSICTDEFDSVFDKTPVIYSIGDHGSINDMDKVLSENFNALLRILMQIVLSYNPDNIKKINQTEYNQHILPRILTLLTESDSLDSGLYPKHTALALKYKTLYRDYEKIKTLLANPKTTPDDIDQEIRGYEEAFNASQSLKMIHYLIHRIFPQSLAMPVDLVYGRSQENPASHVIVPYKNGKECVGAQYNNPYITAVLTYLQSFRDKFTLSQLTEIILHLTPEYKKQFNHIGCSRTKALSPLEKMLDPNTFHEFYEGLHLLSQKSTVLKRKIRILFQDLEQQQSSIHFYKVMEAITIKLIIPQVSYNKAKIRHSWASAPKQSGFSGTTHNMVLFPYHHSPKSKVIDGRTLAKLKACDPTFYSQTFIEDPNWLEAYLSEKSQTRAIIDAGSLINVSNMHAYVKENIEMIYEKTNCTAILYFQETDFFARKRGISSPIKLSSFNRDDINDSLQVPVDQRFVFFSPAYCRGSDLVLKHDANALVMIRKECQLSDTLQAIMRMRKFGSQRVDMLLEKDLLEYFNIRPEALTVDLWWKKTCELDQLRQKNQVVTFTNDYIFSHFQDLLWEQLSEMTPEQKSTFFRKSPDLVERINFCYESTDPINAFQSLVTSLADQYQRQFSFLPEDVINNCKEKVLALIEKMKPHLPTEITLINQEASHEDARQEAVQTQEQVKEQQAENEQEAERACYDSPSPYRPCSILNPESIQKLLKCFPQTLNVSHNYRHTTTYGFSKATLAPVLYVLKANDQWIIITETDKHFYDRGSLSLGSIEYNQTELIDLLALQKDHTALAALNDEDSCHFVYTLLLSGHFRQLQQYLTMPQLKNITTFLTKLQYHEASRELFRELISIHPQHQSHINQLNHTDFASLKAENENKSRILKTFFETTALKKLKRIKESRAKILRWVKKLRDKRKKTSFTPSLMPKYKPANQAELQAAIKRAQGQHSYQYILSLLVFLFTFISVHLSSILWLKLSILVATFNMMNHLFTLNTLKIDMNRRPSLKPYIFLNAYGCSEIDKRQSLKMIKQLETILICITPLSMIYFLYGTPLSMMLVALCAIQFMLNGLKSMMSSQYLSQRLFDHSPFTKSVPQRIKLTLSKHISKGLIRSLPSLSKIKDQSDRLRIALSILSYVHKNHLILSNVPKDYFDELLQFTRSTDSKNYQSFCRLVQYHNVYQPAIQSESLKTGIYQAEALNDKSVEEEKDSLQLKV